MSIPCFAAAEGMPRVRVSRADLSTVYRIGDQSAPVVAGAVCGGACAADLLQLPADLRDAGAGGADRCLPW